jgi:hypothetical protein
MMQSKVLPMDLRELVEQYIGKPLASSANASLWRCPVCPPEAHSLLMVSADQFRCLGRYVCDGGASEWIQDIGESSTDLVLIGESA